MVSSSMANSDEFNSWLRQLECPQFYVTEHVKKTLHTGILGLLWEDLPRIIRPISEVSDTRKNILLYKIKNEPKDALIQSVRNTVNLKEERKRLDVKIKNAKERWKQKEFLCRQKAYLLEKKRQERESLTLKKDILKIKHEQMLMQIEDCRKMQEICHCHMPPCGDEIPQSTIIECLSLVSNYSGGPEKRKVWNKISESLGPIKIPVLWNALLATMSHYTNHLINLNSQNDQEDVDKKKTNIDVGIAKLCSEHIDNVSKRHIHSGRIRNKETMTMEYVEKIEQIIQQQRPDLSAWLPLTLEVKKLETVQFEMQRELEKLEEQLPDDHMMMDDDKVQLIMEIKAVDSQINDCVQEIQNAFGFLKTSRMLITKTKECLAANLEKHALLLRNEKKQWLDIDFNTELITFYNNIDIDALRKIMLKGETRTYKHLQTCFDKASTIVNIQSTTVSNFPMLRIPIYYLVDLYKTFIINETLNKRFGKEFVNTQENVELYVNSPTIVGYSYNGLLELFRLADVTYKRTLRHCEESQQILKAWSNQSAGEIVSKIFCDRKVYGLTLDEWQKRFKMLVYVLQKSNINVA